MFIKSNTIIRITGLTAVFILLILSSVGCVYQKSEEDESWSGLLPSKVYVGPAPHSMTGSEEDKINKVRDHLKKIAAEEPSVPLIALVYLSHTIKPVDMQRFFEKYNINPEISHGVGFLYADGTRFMEISYS